MAVKCPKCDTDNTSDSQFCKKCATPLPSPKEGFASPAAEIGGHDPNSPEFGIVSPDLKTQTFKTPIKDLTTGSTFAGRYQVIEELGHGGMGKVYKVFDTKIKEKIALKLIKPEIAADRETIDRFSNELKLARKIRHPGVCQMFDLGEAEGAHFITMEYVSGDDLKSMLRMMGQLSPGQAISVAKQICRGLEEAHRLGVVHRDLKPQNIMIDREGGVRIMDFGIARSIREKGITGPSVLIGTPEYMSPEQAEAKEVDQRSDIYSLGIILYEMATGRVPFEGDTALSIAMKHKGEIPKNPKELNPNIPDDLSGIILKCLEKDKGNRYQTAADVRSEFEKIEKGIPTIERVVPEKKPLTSKEITVKFRLKKLLVPGVILAGLIIVGAIMIWRGRSPQAVAPAESGKPSVAVLPFVDLSPMKDREYLCDGIAETLINALTNIEGLWVPARTSAFFFKGKTQDIREIGQKLGVDNVLEGSVQVAGDNLRVTARISNVQDGRQIWSDIFNRKMADMFAIQDDIAKAIVTTLKIKLLGEKGAPLVKNYTENLEAYSLYLQGRTYWDKRGEANLIKSIEYFKKAIAIDPNYALAYAGLGDAYSILGNNGIWPPEKTYPMAKTATLKALEIDDRLAEAHASLAGIIGDYDWDFVGAENEFKLAIELNPRYPIAHQWYAYLMSVLGRHEEAIREITIARNLDPLSPRISADAGLFLYFARRYDQAVEELNEALAIDPSHAATYWFLGWAYEAMGKYEDAIKSYRRTFELMGERRETNLGIAGCYALMGRREEARKILNNAVTQATGEYISSEAIAEVFAVLGEKDQTFAWLEKAFRERDPGLINYLKNNHRFNPVRSDARFTDLLRRTGLEK